MNPPRDDYAAFLDRKAQIGGDHGFDPEWMPEFLFDFQRELVAWALRKGRAAIFADCGLGKTPMQLVWAENVVRHTGGRVLILTPLAVSHQTVEEAAKFGIECHRSHAGELFPGIVATNYERLHHFKPEDFAGMVCDESSILKSFDGARRKEITAFMRKLRFRLLATATAAPNDYIELGTSSEALGYLGHVDMLNRFFKNDQNSGVDHGRKWGDVVKWRFKGHAEVPFWRWVCHWARAIRRPSDLGFEDGDFILPPLTERQHDVHVAEPPEGMLFTLPAMTMREQRDERKRTVAERCGMVADIVNGHDRPALAWCHLNEEGRRLAKSIPGCVEVSGADSDDDKEAKLIDFAHGNVRVLVTKPKIGAWGLNFQHCSDIAFFPSHSYEQFYQGIRRCWRFGQKRPVVVDIVTTEGEKAVMTNLRRKSQSADAMFSNLVREMNRALGIERAADFTTQTEVPSWLC